MEETGRFAVHTDLQIARDRRNLAVRAFETLHPADDFEFTIRSQVPLSGGLGTSAAAYVAGPDGRRLDLRARRAAAAPPRPGSRAIPTTRPPALLGGFVVCVGARAARFEVPAGLEAILVVPHKHVRTAKARAAHARPGAARPTPCTTSATRACSCSAWRRATGTS